MANLTLSILARNCILSRPALGIKFFIIVTEQTSCHVLCDALCDVLCYISVTDKACITTATVAAKDDHSVRGTAFFISFPIFPKIISKTLKLVVQVDNIHVTFF